MTEQKVIGWRVKLDKRGWIFLRDRRQAESLAQATNATLEECYRDGTVDEVSRGSGKRK
jgi:hypothetical protein